MDVFAVEIEKRDDTQVVLGHAGFIKTAEDLYEAVVNSVPGVKFGVAFVEASGPCLVRSEGNDPELVDLARKNALAIGAGHTFVVMFKGAFPLNIANSIKNLNEVSRLYCATANPVEVIVTETEQGRAVLGVVDGLSAKGMESDKDRADRRKFVRDLGYKF